MELFGVLSMKNVNTNHLIYALVAISILAFLGLAYFQPDKKELKDYIFFIPTIVTVNTVFYFLFSRYLWKFRIFRGWLVNVPNLNGTWKGEIHSNWKNPETGATPPPIPVILTINQSLFCISCVMRTKEMKSRDFISGFRVDEETQIKELSYSYDSSPIREVRHRSPKHCGTIVFNIIEDTKLRLEGEYWTERLTTGTIKLEFYKTEKLDFFPDDLGIHPVSGK